MVTTKINPDERLATCPLQKTMFQSSALRVLKTESFRVLCSDCSASSSHTIPHVLQLQPTAHQLLKFRTTATTAIRQPTTIAMKTTMAQNTAAVRKAEATRVAATKVAARRRAGAHEREEVPRRAEARKAAARKAAAHARVEARKAAARKAAAHARVEAKKVEALAKVAARKAEALAKVAAARGLQSCSRSRSADNHFTAMRSLIC